MLKDASYDIATLKRDYGLKLDSNAVWYEAFDDATHTITQDTSHGAQCCHECN